MLYMFEEDVRVENKITDYVAKKLLRLKRVKEYTIRQGD